jgi:PAS domain S-box-containing protein
MRPAPPRDDEAASLAALRSLRVLDTGPEAEFDALVAAAALVCEAPISLVSLIDEQRQWFKANLGLEGVSETQRDAAFCAYAVLDDVLLEVPNALEDERFADNPLVTGQPGIRFYAGVPMRLATGHCVGTLCVIDRRPRQLREPQRAILGQLGRAAARLLDGRLAVRMASESMARAVASETRFRALSDGAPVGVFHADAEGAYVYTNRCWREIYGLAPGEGLGTAWMGAIHGVDRLRVLSQWQVAAERGAPFDAEFRIRRTDRAVREVRVLARPVKDDAGALTGYVGSVEDVTERSRLKAFLDRTGQLAGVGGWEVDLRTNVVTWSEEMRRLHGVGPGFVPTLETALDFFGPEGRAAVEAAVRSGVERGIPWDLELPLIDAGGRRSWVRLLGEAVIEGDHAVRLIGAIQDITEQRDTSRALQREQALRLEVERHARATEQLLREREEMLDVLAHEVRQPLNNASAALQGASAVLVEVGNAAASARLRRAQGVLGQVLASIDNNLAVASLLARRDAIQRVDTDIDTLLAVTRADLPAGDRDRVRVVRVTPTRTASMDMSLMRLALRNLLANALRYSPPGSSVEVRLSDLDDPLALVIDVVDTGQGIPEAMLGRLFERGANKARAGGRSSGGMGLGLYIVRRVMELHGGSVELARSGPDGVTMRLVVQQTTDD